MRKRINKKRIIRRKQKKQEVPEWLLDIERLARPEWLRLLNDPEGGARLAKILPQELSADKVSVLGSDERKVWESIGTFFRSKQRWHDAIEIYSSMYYHFLIHQLNSVKRIHKGMPLVWIADCYLMLGNIPLSKKYLMLTLIEDAITMQGNVDPVKTGSYFRLAWRHGVADIELKRYADEAYKIASANPEIAIFPEFVMQEL